MMNNAAVGLMLVMGLGCGPAGSTTPPAEPNATPAPTPDSETAATPQPTAEEPTPAEEAPSEGTYLAAVEDNEIEGGDEGGSSTGEPRGKPVPRVRQAKAKVEGSLDKDIIRRIVRAHINEIRYCYNKQLQEHPEQKGRVVVQFTIGPDGNVDEAALAMTRPEDPQMTTLGECTTERVRKWRFPKPPGAENVVVTYPFVFEPS